MSTPETHAPEINRPEERHEITVGIDPGDGVGPALAWAADEARVRGLPLRLVLSVPALHDLPHGSRRHRVSDSAHRAELRTDGARALAEAAAWVTDTHADVTVATELLDGGPAAVLCGRSAQARLLVLGSRRLGRSAELFSQSSVTVPVSARAACPVAVVAEPPREPRGPAHLVVGVDGSDASRAALAFALEEASLRGASVRAMWVWPQPRLALSGAFADTAGALTGEPVGDEPAAARERHRLLTAAVAGWPEKYPDVSVTEHVLRGHPVEELALASHDAVALVVGRRGHGGYAGMRLGSVVHGLLHRAECPIVTVPAPGD
ncbi:universal stress protein [Streptomyces sp. TRM49041]|uniref:universal stress protein n=1 Tax=Streptomyces sp. TRM49041 TaxID=2603216 RepID=UPI0011ED23CF|nr:universal stress protein [Streptomyces sp. TRM49041]